MLLLFWASTGSSVAAPSIRLSLLAVANPYGTASPSITLSLAPSARVTLFTARATPSITLRLGPALGTQPARAAPSITLALAPVLAAALAQASPSIRLAIEDAHAIGGFTPAGSTVIELEYNATGSTITTVHRIDYEQTGVSAIILSLRE